ncbi:MAG: hypothetical protein E7218_05880 [Anaerofustis stercorihominis]|nr:hypothetical protein [Anaerofustis stercorihominis]
MKIKNAYIFVFAAMIILNMPMSVTNVSAWEDSLETISKHAINQSIHLPQSTEKADILELINTNVLSSAISVLGYEQETINDDKEIPDNTGSNTNDKIPDNNNTNMSTSRYENISSDYSKLHNGKPKVLIYHTHTTEAYLTSPDAKPSSWRSTDPKKNLITVGSVVSQVLHDEYGIEVLYLSEIFDQPYTGAYSKSYDAAEAAIKKYPSIEYVFDIHRDGLANKEGNRDIYLTNIEGQDCASIMFVLSTESPYIDEMRVFAKQIKNKMNTLYPTLFRRNMDRNYCYNMVFSPNSMLFEVGSNLTTVSEARTSAVFLGRTLGEIITGKE